MRNVGVLTMKYTIVQHGLVIFSLVLLSGCGTIGDFAKQSFGHGEDRLGPKIFIEDFMQSKSVYDQFTTCAKFDVLWLADEIRQEYVRLYATRRGLSQTQQDRMIKRELEANEQFMTFYVLSLHRVTLGKPESDWSIFLQVDDAVILPIEVKEDELIPEYQAILGHRYNRFKQLYRVSFDISDIGYTAEELESFSLTFRSIYKDVAFDWDIYPLAQDADLEKHHEEITKKETGGNDFLSGKEKTNQKRRHRKRGNKKSKSVEQPQEQAQIEELVIEVDHETGNRG